MSGIQATTALVGCGGSAEGASAPAPALPVAWDPAQLFFIVDIVSSVDLSHTLPLGVVRGGTFQLAPGSSPLPPDFTLSPNGILLATRPAIGLTVNIVFTYTEPG
ncbi:MAG: hypothetical protein ACREBN_13015 [Burkholderiaceae bacterium]